MIPKDLELLILSYTSFGEFLTFYESDKLESKIKSCYKELPSIYEVIEDGDLIGVKYLVKPEDNKVKYKIYKAIKYGYLDILDYLLNFYDPGVDEYKIILHTIRKENIEILSYLIQKYNYIFDDYDFEVAVDTKNLDLIKFVIAKYPDKFDWIAELILQNYPKLKIFKFAVSIGIKMSTEELCMAQYFKHPDFVEYIESQLKI